mmetsp:Transcript_15225/g.20863  ORF Transcript_15225/g.20863 Transcript_15225/m.20863 type:complete len:212 (+) Transcript_15225:2471-3106(+)
MVFTASSTISARSPLPRYSSPSPRHMNLAEVWFRSASELSIMRVRIPLLRSSSQVPTKVSPSARAASEASVAYSVEPVSLASTASSRLRTSSFLEPAYAIPRPQMDAVRTALETFASVSESDSSASAGSASLRTPLQRMPTPRQAPALTRSSELWKYLSSWFKPSSTFHSSSIPCDAAALSMPCPLFLNSQLLRVAAPSWPSGSMISLSLQ